MDYKIGHVIYTTYINIISSHPLPLKTSCVNTSLTMLKRRNLRKDLMLQLSYRQAPLVFFFNWSKNGRGVLYFSGTKQILT